MKGLSLFLLGLVIGCLIGVGGFTPRPALATAPTTDPPTTQASATPTRTPTSAPTDACEPNDTPDTACTIPLDASSGVLALPPGDVDYLTVDLGETPAPPINATMRASQGLDFLLTIQQGDRTIRTLTSAAPTVTLPSGLTGVLTIRVENLTLDADGTYVLTLSRQAPTSTALPSATPQPSSTALPSATPQPTSTPGAAARPDECEPNDTAATACTLPRDAVSGLLTLLPAGDVDYYRVDLGAADGTVPSVRVTGDRALALVTTIQRPAGTVLALLEAPDEQITLPAQTSGVVLLRVESRATDDSVTGGYRVEVRRVTPTATPTGTREPTRTPEPTTTPDPTRTPSPTPERGMQDDGCEPNEDIPNACALGLNTTSPPQTMPPGDQDVFVVDTGNSGGAVTVQMYQASPLDLVLTFSDANGQSLGTLASPAVSTTLTADLLGALYIVAHNRSLEEPGDATYRIEVRRGGTGADPAPGSPVSPPPFAAPAGQSIAPDSRENNWHSDLAAPLALDQSLRLNFACPVQMGCEGGDHDWFIVPVKRGSELVVGTFDLAPGVDTVLTLFVPRSAAPPLEITANDDATAGLLGSLLRYTPVADGNVLILVAPRHGRVAAQAEGRSDSAYTLGVSTPDQPLGQSLLAQIAPPPPQETATLTPSPTATPTPTVVLAPPPFTGVPPALPPAPPAAPPAADPPDSAPPSPPAVVDALLPTPQPAPTGAAVVISTTHLLTGPDDAGSDLIRPLEVGEDVVLLGEARGLWVFVETADSVRPGWINARDVRRQSGIAAVEPVPGSAPGALAPSPTPTRPAARIEIERRPPLLSDPVPTTVPQEALPITVQLVETNPQLAPTPAPGAGLPFGGEEVSIGVPLPGLRVQLVTVFGDVLTEAVTPEDGRVTLTRDVAPGTALWVLVPAAGVLVPVDPEAPDLTIALPIRTLNDGGTP